MELAHGSGSLSDSVFGEVSREDELDGSLDIVGADGVLSLASVELGSFEGDSFEEVDDETVHDAHGLLGDSNVAVDVLEDSVDVDAVAVEFLSSVSALLCNSLGNLLGRSLASHLYI